MRYSWKSRWHQPVVRVEAQGLLLVALIILVILLVRYGRLIPWSLR
ncbi:MAG TPA: hypothetical protein VEG30_01370 [Terriglobales bacterium]|nr:hypothetical protein [Terriglobales bacterium]